MANKLMSKSELIQKLAEKHADAVTRKDVKGVIESLAEIGTKNSRKRVPSLCLDLRNS
jgi:nucleoid DNA-binding protein